MGNSSKEEGKFEMAECGCRPRNATPFAIRSPSLAAIWVDSFPSESILASSLSDDEFRAFTTDTCSSGVCCAMTLRKYPKEIRRNSRIRFEIILKLHHEFDFFICPNLSFFQLLNRFPLNSTERARRHVLGVKMDSVKLTWDVSFFDIYEMMLRGSFSHFFPPRCFRIVMGHIVCFIFFVSLKPLS